MDDGSSSGSCCHVIISSLVRMMMMPSLLIAVFSAILSAVSALILLTSCANICDGELMKLHLSPMPCLARTIGARWRDVCLNGAVNAEAMCSADGDSISVVRYIIHLVYDIVSISQLLYLQLVHHGDRRYITDRHACREQCTIRHHVFNNLLQG